jgi:8-oxo-dGTP pyrophosphatase MutT (NUDIX family)
MKHIDKVAWVRVENGRVLSSRSRGKGTFYLPGGKREPGESDEDCVCREIEEELAVRLRRDTLRKLGVFKAQAHGKAEGVQIHMACYAGDFEGELRASAEIEEFVWLSYADRERVAPVDKIIFDWLRERGELK